MDKDNNSIIEKLIIPRICEVTSNYNFGQLVEFKKMPDDDTVLTGKVIGIELRNEGFLEYLVRLQYNLGNHEVLLNEEEILTKPNKRNFQHSFLFSIGQVVSYIPNKNVIAYIQRIHIKKTLITYEIRLYLEKERIDLWVPEIFLSATLQQNVIELLNIGHNNDCLYQNVSHHQELTYLNK